MSDKIEKVNLALGRYYKSQGAEYDDIFKNFCEDNNLDDEGVDDDLGGDYKDSMFPDELDENFPGVPSGRGTDQTRGHIFKKILECWKNPDIVFDEPKKTEDKKNEKKSNDDEKKEDKDKKKNTVKNGLVLIIGISEYDDPKRLPNLPGVCKDVENYRDLWENVYKYRVYPSKTEAEESKEHKTWYDKKNWKSDEINNYIEKGRELLFKKEKKRELAYDGLFIVICGHGDQNRTIYSSDGKLLEISIFHKKVNGKWKYKATTIPRLFIVDCCRGGQLGGAVEKPKERDAGGKAHQDDLLCTLYGNSDNIVVEEIKGKGGMFSSCLIDALKVNAAEKGKKTLSAITVAASMDLRDKSDKNQVLNKEGDPAMDLFTFEPK